MYTEPTNDPTLLILYAILETIIPLVTGILLVLIAWYVFKSIVLFPTRTVSTPDEREQQQRHRRENFVARMAFLCLIVGVVLSIFGYAEGIIVIKLPLGLEFAGAGVGVVLIGAMCFILYLLLRLVYSQSEKDQVSGLNRESLTVSTRNSGVTTSTTLDSGVATSTPVINSSYIKIGLITLVLLPTLGPFALIVGGFLIWKISKS